MKAQELERSYISAILDGTVHPSSARQTHPKAAMIWELIKTKAMVKSLRKTTQRLPKGVPRQCLILADN